MSAASQHFGNAVTRVTIVTAMAGLVIIGPADAAEKFEEADIRLEQNIADKDVEVNFDVKTHSGGIASLQVMAPDGRLVIDFKSPRSKFGMRNLSFETPEPPNDGRIQADFPAGAYRFIGTTTAGESVEAIATLHHALPPAPQLASPSAGQENVPIIGVKVRWKPMPEAAAFVVVLEDENSGRSIKANLTGKATEFSVPAGFLKFGGEYKAEVGSVAKNGNRTFVEHEFSTAKRR